MRLFRSAQYFFEDNAFVPYTLAFTAAKALQAKKRQEFYLRTYNLKPLKALTSAQVKKSDVLFILGSGASVNDYREEEWQKIRDADSLGFNFWFVHDFVPDIYVIEPMGPPRNKEFYDLLNQRAEDYKGVPFVMKATDTAPFDFQRIPSQLHNQLYVCKYMAVPGRWPERIKQAYAIYKRFGVFEPHQSLDVMMQKRASLSGLLHLAVAWGYKQVVLCGVDLNNTDYFYTANRKQYIDKGRIVPSTGQEGGVHLTMDPAVARVTIDKVLAAMNEVVLKPQHVKLWVALSSSALYPMLPAYFR